jgi:phosphatidylglycerol:prolipoprotein diacylglycerol transferase
VIPNPHIDPVLIRLGPIALRWYGLMYVFGLTAAFFLIKARAARRKLTLPLDHLHDLILYAAIGVIVGGRLGYSLFYNFSYYLEHPVNVLAVWEGGMSFHGGLLGVLIAALIFCWRKGYSFYTLADLATPAAPIGLGLGRLGNFINGELYGRPTDVAWCMVFDTTGGGPVCRHPSQLYEAFLEGIALFIVVWMVDKRFAEKSYPPGVVFWTFITGYALCRIFVEFFREPDAHLGFFGGFMTMGQILSAPMLLIGLFMLAKTFLGKRTLRGGLQSGRGASGRAGEGG